MATNSIGISYLHLYPNTLKPTLARQNEPFYIGVNCDGMNIGISDGDGLLIALKQLESKRLRDVYIHHAMGFDIRLLYRILSELGNKKGRFWLHDYFSLCPGYNLLSNNRRYCGAPDMDSNACLICIYGETRRKQQPAFIKLFKDYQLELVAPSSYTLALWKEKFPVSMASEKVIPHAKIKWVGTIPARKIDDPLRIGFVGYPVYHKGWETWLRLVNQFSDDDRYRFFHFSNTPGTPGNYKRVNVAVTKDKRLSMVEALKDNQIDIAFLWSPWPETFSFTLHESLAAGCYILTYKDSGNIQNYLKQNVNRGLVLEDEQALFKLFSGNDLNSIVADYQQNGRPQAELIFLSELE
jgi:glycosyltransferase involved in cell wall biosynthesis